MIGGFVLEGGSGPHFHVRILVQNIKNIGNLGEFSAFLTFYAVFRLFSEADPIFQK